MGFPGNTFLIELTRLLILVASVMLVVTLSRWTVLRFKNRPLGAS